MASIRFKAGVLAFNADYFGGKTQLPTKDFELDKVTSLQVGWLHPPTDSGVGTASNVLGFSELQQDFSNDKVAACFLYDEKFNQRDRYMITCTSADIKTMQGSGLTNSSTPLYYELLTSNSYTLAT